MANPELNPQLPRRRDESTRKKAFKYPLEVRIRNTRTTVFDDNVGNRVASTGDVSAHVAIRGGVAGCVSDDIFNDG